MGLATRIRRITVARIEEFLSSAEDPERLMPQLVREMEDQVRAATSAEAMAMVSVKAAQRDEEDLKTRVQRYAAGAQQAMTQGDEATAREAITAQIKLEADLARKEEGRARAETTLEDARESRKQIQAQLEDLRVNKDEIMTRAKVAHNRGFIEKSVGREDPRLARQASWLRYAGAGVLLALMVAGLMGILAVLQRSGGAVQRNTVLDAVPANRGLVLHYSSELRIGNSKYNAQNVSGKIADVRIYNLALSDLEIKRLFAMNSQK